MPFAAAQRAEPSASKCIPKPPMRRPLTQPSSPQVRPHVRAQRGARSARGAGNSPAHSARGAGNSPARSVRSAAHDPRCGVHRPCRGLQAARNNRVRPAAAPGPGRRQ
jgi:hypothetical protein